MELSIYKTLSDIEKNYLIEYSKYSNSLTPLEFYSKYHDLYSAIYREFDSLCEKLNTHKLGLLYKTKYSRDSENIFLNILGSEIESAVSSLIIKDIDSLISNIEFSINKSFFKIKLETLKEETLINYNDEIDFMQSELIGIMYFFETLIETEKTNLLRFSNNSNQIQPVIEKYQNETGSKNIPYKLALLRELGLMDILNRKYDNNKEQLYRILNFLTGGNSKNYYLSMYGDDYNGKDKVTQSHNVYLRKNKLI